MLAKNNAIQVTTFKKYNTIEYNGDEQNKLQWIAYGTVQCIALTRSIRTSSQYARTYNERIDRLTLSHCGAPRAHIDVEIWRL